MSESPAEYQRLTVEIKGHVLLIGLNRAEKRNAFDLQMLKELGQAITQYEKDASLWCALLYAHGAHFTAGLDLAEVGPAVQNGAALFPEGSIDPLGVSGPARTKPLVMAVQGWCLTIGIELLLASDIRLAAEGTKFGQIEIKRGIFPFGGATIRLPQVAGWGNAMRYLLTGDVFDEQEAYRIGLVQEICSKEELFQKGLEMAEKVAKQAPLGVQATMASSKMTLEKGPEAAAQALLEQAKVLMASEDAKEGLLSFIERRDGNFQGK